MKRNKGTVEHTHRLVPTIAEDTKLQVKPRLFGFSLLDRPLLVQEKSSHHPSTLAKSNRANPLATSLLHQRLNARDSISTTLIIATSIRKEVGSIVCDLEPIVKGLVALEGGQNTRACIPNEGSVEEMEFELGFQQVFELRALDFEDFFVGASAVEAG